MVYSELFPLIYVLGSFIDSKLNWREHVFNVKKKKSPKVGLIRKLKHIVPQDCLIKYYMATVQSQIDYCLSVWGYSSDANCKILQRLQNRAARIISDNFDWNVRGIDIVKYLGWINVCQRRDYFTAITVYKSLAGLQPSYITDLFTLSRDIATRKTRSCCTNKLFLPKANKSSFKCSLQYAGATIWNNLPDIIRNIDTLNVFKHTLKQFLTSSE